MQISLLSDDSIQFKGDIIPSERSQYMREVIVKYFKSVLENVQTNEPLQLTMNCKCQTSDL
jgi:hypothetical protein